MNSICKIINEFNDSLMAVLLYPWVALGRCGVQLLFTQLKRVMRSGGMRGKEHWLSSREQNY